MPDMTSATPRHKGQVHFGARYSCSCGWQSCTWWGKGARGQAAEELAIHKENEGRAALALAGEKETTR